MKRTEDEDAWCLSHCLGPQIRGMDGKRSVGESTSQTIYLWKTFLKTAGDVVNMILPRKKPCFHRLRSVVEPKKTETQEERSTDHWRFDAGHQRDDGTGKLWTRSTRRRFTTSTIRGGNVGDERWRRPVLPLQHNVKRHWWAN